MCCDNMAVVATCGWFTIIDDVAKTFHLSFQWTAAKLLFLRKEASPQFNFPFLKAIGKSPLSAETVPNELVVCFMRSFSNLYKGY